MNICIMTDLEGISGIYCREQVIPGQWRFDEGRRFLTREVNICAEACKAAGVDKVYVRDGHGGGYTLLWDKLGEAVDAVSVGTTSDNIRYVEVDECDAYILLGYHAMAGTHNGVLEHTMSSTSVQNYWLNDVRIGEVALDAAGLTDHGKPVIMVSGDSAVCAEAKQFLPRVVTAEVKKGFGLFGATMLPPAQAEKCIRESVAKAIAAYRAGEYDLYPTEKPVRLRVEKMERIQIPNVVSKPYMKIIDGRTYEVVADTVEEALFRL